MIDVRVRKRVIAHVSGCVCGSALLWAGLLAGSALSQAPADAGVEVLHRSFQNPPDSARIMVRWWWFGPAVTEPEITRELEQMKGAGIGGVEIANLYALGLDDEQTGVHNAAFLSDEHLARLHFAVAEARRLGLRVDITLGSGWPLGGPEIPVTEAAGKLRVESQTVAAGATTALAPLIDQGEELMAAFVLPEAATPEQVQAAAPLAAPVAGSFSFAAASEDRSLICFISSRTGMVVKRPAVGAEGFVLDHYDRAATEAHLRAVGDRLLKAFGDQPPYAVFSDSLEDYASDWTPRFLKEFQRRRGYDLRTHLPALVMDAGPDTAAIRHDWGRTLTELADENFLAPLRAWAAAHHTLLRSQTYGYPPVTLYSNRLADLPEGEGKATFKMWREFSDTRWAASAGHLFHRPVISSETWTWLHSPAFRATPLDMKAEADLHFLQGINQLVGHGWPYSPASAGEPGWRMYAAAALNAHNPWFFAMPDLTRYLQRVSFALRQGEPANDVALLLPNDDVWASFSAGLQKRASPTSPLGFDESGSNITIDEQMDKFLGKQVIAQVLDAGFNLDFIDADSIENAGIPYRVLILPNVNRLPAGAYEKVVAYAQRGGIVIATGRMPATAPGMVDKEQDSARIKELSQALFRAGMVNASFVAEVKELGAALTKALKPDMKLTPATPEIGFMHRKLPGGDLYFVANTSNESKSVHAEFRDRARHAEIWDAFNGEITGLPDPGSINLNLEAYGSRLIYFSDTASAASSLPARPEEVRTDLSSDWRIEFPGGAQARELHRLSSWSENAATQYFSGIATYEKTFNLAQGNFSRTTKFFLDFGNAVKVQLPDPPGENNMRAYLDAPIREAAQVWINGKLAGCVWRPPYRIEVTAQLHAGPNQLRVVVGNTAINELAGHPLPDYRLLWDRYGRLFEPQGMHDLKPLPSGMLGPVTLIESDSVE